MKEKISKLKKAEISPRIFWLCAAALVAARLLLLSRQTMTLYPETSMLDDMLMVRAARSILDGQWLGAYNYLTIGKHMLFAVWLALISKLGISYLLAGQLLYMAACFALVQSLAPLLRRRLLRLGFLGWILFNPASYADFTLRVYRDSITVSFVLLFFAGMLGLALRCTDSKTGKMVFWGLLGGFALGCSLLLREDGWWLLPFAAAALISVLFQLIRKKPARIFPRLLALTGCAAAAAVCILSYCGMNYRYYGRFIISDLTSSEFQAAYGAMTRVIADPEDVNPIVPIPRSSREKLYQASPLFAELAPYLESDDFRRWQKDCGDGVLEYSGGGFYWAVRNAASLAGYYETPETARQFYLALAGELNAACDSGDFEALSGERSGLNSPITADRILPTLKESLRSLYTVVSYAGIDDSPQISVGSELVMDELEQFLHEEAKRTTKIENGASRIVVWAFAADGPVEVALVDEQGGAVDAGVGFNTGSDVYLDELYAGRDQRYTDACRRTFFLPASSLEGISICITAPSGSVTIPAQAMAESESDQGITWRVEYAGADYSEQVTFGFAEIWLYRLMRVITLVYRIFNSLFFLAAIFLFFKALLRPKKLCRAAFFAGLGLLVMAALRIGMVSFAEISAFGIGTNPMYLAAVYPLLIAFQFLSPVFQSPDFDGAEKGESR